MTSQRGPPRPPPRRVAVLDTSVFSRPRLFRDRRRNLVLRAHARLVTTSRALEECRRLGFHVPPFVEVVRVALLDVDRALAAQGGASGLSLADVSLRRLALELAASGRQAILVSDDDALRAATPGALDPEAFLALLGLPVAPAPPAPRRPIRADDPFHAQVERALAALASSEVAAPC